MNNSQKKLADYIIDHFKKKPDEMLRMGDLKRGLQDVGNGYTPNAINYVTEILVSKDLLRKNELHMIGNSIIEATYYLSTKGWLYESYDKIIEEENAEKQLLKEQIKSATEANKSVKLTNRFIINNSKRQNRLTTASILVASASALFALGSVGVSLYAASNEKTFLELQSLKLQLQKLSQIQEKMSQFQKGIDSSLKISVERSSNKDN